MLALPKYFPKKLSAPPPSFCFIKGHCPPNHWCEKSHYILLCYDSIMFDFVCFPHFCSILISLIYLEYKFPCFKRSIYFYLQSFYFLFIGNGCLKFRLKYCNKIKKHLTISNSSWKNACHFRNIYGLLKSKKNGFPAARVTFIFPMRYTSNIAFFLDGLGNIFDF